MVEVTSALGWLLCAPLMAGAGAAVSVSGTAGAGVVALGSLLAEGESGIGVAEGVEMGEELLELGSPPGVGTDEPALVDVVAVGAGEKLLADVLDVISGDGDPLVGLVVGPVLKEEVELGFGLGPLVSQGCERVVGLGEAVSLELELVVCAGEADEGGLEFRPCEFACSGGPWVGHALLPFCCAVVVLAIPECEASQRNRIRQSRNPMAGPRLRSRLGMKNLSVCGGVGDLHV